ATKAAQEKEAFESTEAGKAEKESIRRKGLIDLIEKNNLIGDVSSLVDGNEEPLRKFIESCRQKTAVKKAANVIGGDYTVECAEQKKEAVLAAVEAAYQEVSDKMSQLGIKPEDLSQEQQEILRDFRKSIYFGAVIGSGAFSAPVPEALLGTNAQGVRDVDVAA